MDKITMAIIIVAYFIISYRVWYHEGYKAALKDVMKMLNDNRKERRGNDA